MKTEKKNKLNPAFYWTTEEEKKFIDVMRVKGKLEEYVKALLHIIIHPSQVRRIEVLYKKVDRSDLNL